MNFLRWIWRAIEHDDSRSKWRQFLGISVLIGIIAIVLRTGGSDLAAMSVAAMLAGASLFAGVLAGFLFGIPKTAQRKVDTTGAPALSEGDYQPNTNLEEISDWLTKMLVGVGLVELRNVPGYVNRLAAYWEGSLGPSYSRAYAAGIIVYFSTIGFLIGYLWTRLALVGDFIEKDPRRLISQLLKGVAQSAEENPEVTERSPTRQVVTRQELDAARTLASISAESKVGMDELRKQLVALSAEYEAVRSSMSPSAERTRRMEVIASQMRTFSIAAYSLLSELCQSDSPGQRLAAITFLQARPNHTYLKWLAERLRVEKPFVGYHAAVALQHAARAATAEEGADVRNTISEALESVRHLSDSTDRVAVLNDALSILK